MNDLKKRENDNNSTSFKKILFLGFIPLIIAALICISLSLCIQLSRCYSNWCLRNQLTILESPEQCLIVSNPSLDNNDQQLFPQVV
jgi:hypothetical protein